MRLRRVLLALLLVVLAVGAAPPSAEAGGPTSVLMVSPDRERAQAAYYNDAVYAQLAAGVGDDQLGSSEPPRSVTGGTDAVRLTWLIHDMQIWRIDRIQLTSDDGIWIATGAEITGEDPFAETSVRWHRPADEAALMAALTTAGLLGDSAPAAPAAPAAEAAAPARAPLSPVLAAGLGGVLLGAVGAIAAVRLRRPVAVARPDRVTLLG